MSGFGERLRSVRERLGWTRAFLPNQTGGVVTEGALEGLEYGARKQLSVEELLALSQALRIPPVWILTDIDDPDGHSDYPPLAHMGNKEILRLFRQFRRPPCLTRPDDEDGELATGSPGVAPPAVKGARPASEARRTMRPGIMSVTDAARRLCCQPGLVEELSRRGYLPHAGTAR